jgi:AAA+ superfamily predicted ATPase
MPGSETKSFDWIFRHAVPFARLLRETENDCVDRITAALPPEGRPIEREHEPEIHTAAWLAMRSWKEEISPCYEKLISMPDVSAATRLGLDGQYSGFLRMVADALVWCEQYAAAKKLLFEGRAQFGDVEGDARKGIEENLGDLQKTEQKLGLIFDPEAWEDAMPSAVKGKTASQAPAEQKSTVERPTQDHGSGFSMVAGMSELKEQLIHEVMGPVKNPELYREYRVSLPNGILFYGPPGCGKTYIARSLAEELGWFFQHCQPSDVASPYIHDTVVKIRGLFALAVEKAPSVLFIDEFEAFVPARSDLGGHQQYKAEEVNEFLANLEGCAGREVLVIAATNEPDKIDSAVRRSGRFDKLIFIPPPDAEARSAMLDFHLRGRPVQSPFDTAGMAGILDGYSASDIKLLVDEAARMALQRREPISIDTLLAALERVPASISKEDIQRYSSFRSRGTSRRGD